MPIMTHMLILACAGTAAGQTFLQYTFGTAKKAGFNTFRFFALVSDHCKQILVVLMPLPSQYLCRALTGG